MDFSNFYTLTYRLKTNPHPLTHFFKFEGKKEDTPVQKLASAVIRGRQFCDTMDFRFHSVYPMISDLEKIENRYLGRSAVYQAAPHAIG